jgi:hypothetical protein
MTWHKYKCLTCKDSVYSEEDPDTYKCDVDETHPTQDVKKLNGEDYAVFWYSDLEDENRHSLTDMPNAILAVLEEEIWDAKIVRRIMKKLYEKRVGLE